MKSQQKTFLRPGTEQQKFKVLRTGRSQQGRGTKTYKVNHYEAEITTINFQEFVEQTTHQSSTY